MGSSPAVWETTAKGASNRRRARSSGAGDASIRSRPVQWRKLRRRMAAWLTRKPFRSSGLGKGVISRIVARLHSYQRRAGAKDDEAVDGGVGEQVRDVAGKH